MCEKALNQDGTLIITIPNANVATTTTTTVGTVTAVLPTHLQSSNAQSPRGGAAD